MNPFKQIEEEKIQSNRIACNTTQNDRFLYPQPKIQSSPFNQVPDTPNISPPKFNTNVGPQRQSIPGVQIEDLQLKSDDTDPNEALADNNERGVASQSIEFNQVVKDANKSSCQIIVENPINNSENSPSKSGQSFEDQKQSHNNQNHQNRIQ